MNDIYSAPQTHLREAVEGDIPRMQEIRAAVRENILSDPLKVTIEDYRWFILKGPMWVYEENHIIKGMSAGDPRNGMIWALFVDPEFERHGIGRLLFDRACRSLLEAGHFKASLYTDANSRAERFYRAAGWHGEHSNPKGDIVFTKTLQQEPKLP